MKRIIFTAASIAALLICSCAKEEPAGNPSAGGEALFSVEGITAAGGNVPTRAAHNYSINDYFTLGEGFDRVQVEYGGTHIYVLDPEDNLFEGVTPADVIRFPQDGTPLSEVTMSWPVDEGTTESGVVRDQSRRVDFMRMDRLAGTIRNVMPTTVISITMSHVRSKITFTLGGAHAGKRIEELSIGDFKAWCDPSLDDAQLIYDQVGDAGALGVDSQGAVKIAGVADTQRFVLMDSPDAALGTAAGNYTVTISF